MAMINMAFHRKNLVLVLLTDLYYKLFKPGFQSIYQEYLSPIAWAEYEMIID